MKAGILYANDDIRCGEMQTPHAGDTDVLVRIKATGICGSDLPRVFYGGAHYYPIVLGHEFAGEIVEKGAAVTSLEIGDRVAGAPLVPCMKCKDCARGHFSQCKFYTFIGTRIQGGYAEYIVLPERNAVRFDPDVTYEQGALFEPSTVAAHALRCASFQGGKDIAIIGAGTIGLFVLQWARIFGASSITMINASKGRLDTALELGADRVISLSEPDAMKRINEIEYDYVFEAAGKSESINLAIEIAANNAHISVLGTPYTDVTFQSKLWEKLNRKELNISGPYMSYSAPFPGEEWSLTAKYFKSGALRLHENMIYKRFSLSEIDRAFALFKKPGLVKGKVLMLP